MVSGGVNGVNIRIPGHHRILLSPSSQSLKVPSSKSHSPVPSCRRPKKSFCLLEKFALDNQAMISRLSCSKAHTQHPQDHRHEGIHVALPFWLFCSFKTPFTVSCMSSFTSVILPLISRDSLLETVSVRARTSKVEGSQMIVLQSINN